MGTPAVVRPFPARTYAPASSPKAVLRQAGASAPAAPTYTPSYASGVIACAFSKAIFETLTLKNPATWTVTPPMGKPAVAVTGVTFPDAQTVAVAIYGDVSAGGTYTISVPEADVASTDLAYMATGQGIKTFNITAGTPVPPPYVAGPHVANVSPAAPSSITQNTTLVFDLLDYDTSMPLGVVAVSFPRLGIVELVHDGTQFMARYASSTRSGIANGYHYVIQRDQGWPESPTVIVTAADLNGAVL